MIFQDLFGQKKIVVEVVKSTNHRLVIDPSFFTLNTLFGCSGSRLVARRPLTNAAWVRFPAGDLIRRRK